MELRAFTQAATARDARARGKHPHGAGDHASTCRSRARSSSVPSFTGYRGLAGASAQTSGGSEDGRALGHLRHSFISYPRPKTSRKTGC